MTRKLLTVAATTTKQFKHLFEMMYDELMYANKQKTKYGYFLGFPRISFIN
jgi:hypothetical protein